MDSNFQYASTERWHRATDLLLPPTVKRRSAGRRLARRHEVHPARARWRSTRGQPRDRFYISYFASAGETVTVLAAIVLLCGIGFALFGIVALGEWGDPRWYGGEMPVGGVI